MPTSQVSIPGVVTWTWEPKAPEVGPRASGMTTSPLFTGFNDFPERESRVRPKGDAFDTATPRTTRSGWVQYTQCIHHESGDDYYYLTTKGPVSHWYGSPTLISSVEASFNWPDGSSGVSTCFPYLGLEARTKIKNQKVNLLQALGERKQTARLVSDLALDLVRVAKSLVRTGGASMLSLAAADVLAPVLGPNAKVRRRSLSTGSKRAAKRWLQAQYGIRPAMSDIYGSFEAIAVRAQRGLNHYSTHSRVLSDQRDFSQGLYTENVRVRTWSKMRVRWSYGPSPLVELGSLGFTNPLALAWELTPWSFVADWVLDMGRFLNGLDALAGVPTVSVIQSFRRECEVSGTYKGNLQTGYLFGKATVTRRYGVSHAVPYGFPTFENPMKRNGVIRALNALALMRAKIRL